MNEHSQCSITISILTYNRSELLCSMLEQLHSLKYEPLEIIVIDNHSEDNTQTVVKEKYPKVNFIRTDTNIGVSARNIGMKKAMGEIVITLDDDIKDIQDEDLLTIINLFNERTQLGAVNFKIVDRQGEISNWVHHCKEEENNNKEFRTYEITEGAVAFRKKTLEQCGYYSEHFFISHEGPDLAFRIFNCGYDVIYSNLIQVTHYSSDEAREPWRNYYFDTRNQFWLAIRNFPILYSILYLSRGLISMMLYSIRDGYFIYWLKAIRDAIRGYKYMIQERKVLSITTMSIIKQIDSDRPALLYLIKKRLFNKGLRF